MCKRKRAFQSEIYNVGHKCVKERVCVCKLPRHVEVGHTSPASWPTTGECLLLTLEAVFLYHCKLHSSLSLVVPQRGRSGCLLLIGTNTNTFSSTWERGYFHAQNELYWSHLYTKVIYPKCIFIACYLKETPNLHPRTVTHQSVCLLNGSLHLLYHRRARVWCESCLWDQLCLPALLHASLLWLDVSRVHQSLPQAGESVGRVRPCS